LVLSLRGGGIKHEPVFDKRDFSTQGNPLITYSESCPSLSNKQELSETCGAVSIILTIIASFYGFSRQYLVASNKTSRAFKMA
jgi:hypothetical protein